MNIADDPWLDFLSYNFEQALNLPLQWFARQEDRFTAKRDDRKLSTQETMRLEFAMFMRRLLRWGGEELRPMPHPITVDVLSRFQTHIEAQISTLETQRKQWISVRQNATAEGVAAVMEEWEQLLALARKMIPVARIRESVEEASVRRRDLEYHQFMRQIRDLNADFQQKLAALAKRRAEPSISVNDQGKGSKKKQNSLSLFAL